LEVPTAGGEVPGLKDATHEEDGAQLSEEALRPCSVPGKYGATVKGV
jgi:hypothetical protein